MFFFAICSLENMLCWSSYLHLEYDNVTKRCSSPQGVEVRVPGFGDTATIEYIDPSWTAWSLGNVGAYLKPCVDSKNVIPTYARINMSPVFFIFFRET